MLKYVARLLFTMAVGACLALSGCVFINSSAISEAEGGGTAVGATFSGYGILHLSEPANLTPGANADLIKQCQSGHLTDVQTELSMRDWFFIVQYYTVTANAVCK